MMSNSQNKTKPHMLKIAIIGSGISGLGAAYELHQRSKTSNCSSLNLDITLFEAHEKLGGHANTIDVTLPHVNGTESVTYGVDTGFLVFNENTYPRFIALLKNLGVVAAKSEMSFSVKHPQVEWSGTNLKTLFAQRRNALRPRFWHMLWDIWRFNRLATLMVKGTTTSNPKSPTSTEVSTLLDTITLAQFLEKHQFGKAFQDWYFLPMLGCIWSCPVEQMLDFPIATLLRFCHNHGLLQIANRPQWWTVQGGSQRYIDALVKKIGDAMVVHLDTPVVKIDRIFDEVTHKKSVLLHTKNGMAYFDRVVIATHPDQTLAMLAQPTAEEMVYFSAIRYQENTAVLHTDVGVLPKNKNTWAAWNYEHQTSQIGKKNVCLHYWLNRLQPLPFKENLVLSLNPVSKSQQDVKSTDTTNHAIDKERVIATFTYHHPVFDAKAISAQQKITALQGNGGVYFCGAWLGYGFHEDGLSSGQKAALMLLSH